jgi:hypothetical protein
MGRSAEILQSQRARRAGEPEKPQHIFLDLCRIASRTNMLIQTTEFEQSSLVEYIASLSHDEIAKAIVRLSQLTLERPIAGSRSDSDELLNNGEGT